MIFRQTTNTSDTPIIMGDIANVKNSNLKVPPLKIVLSSATSAGSDRSSSSSPSSESESLDSNLTIISDNQHDKSNSSKSDNKEETVNSKQERATRHNAKGSTGEKGSSTSTALGNKKSHDYNGSEPNNTDPVVGRDQSSSSSSTQRITRSSQRAAQQNKSENPNETNSDDTIVTEAQDKTIESARKVKRRKGEPQDNEQDSNQQVPPPTLVMANICPTDYELPSQNSFELYRDIRKRPYKKLMKLTTTQPKVPHGFKNYLLSSGPYLLDGNRIGIGIKGRSSINRTESFNARSCPSSNRVPPKLKYTNIHPKFSPAPSNQRHNYDIPRLLEAPKNLKFGSPLYELFQDQEKARQRMRMQHLKERERSVLTAEQEILRAYNRAAINDVEQDLNLSACAYFYLQERYHYIDDKNDSVDSMNPKLMHSQTNSGENQVETDGVKQLSPSDKGLQCGQTTKSSTNLTDETRESSEKSEKQTEEDGTGTPIDSSHDTKPSQKKKKCHDEDYRATVDDGGLSDISNISEKERDNGTSGSCKSHEDHPLKKSIIDPRTGNDKDEEGVNEESNDSRKTAAGEEQPVEVSKANQTALNKSAFLHNLQEIDDKWTNIKKEMLIRHKNEADSLFAVQSLDWEWKAKEIGACDVRVALKIEPEFVPRVEVSALDY